MRFIILSFIMLSFSLYSQDKEEKFYVIQVFGNVYNAADSLKIEKGDKLFGDDKLFCATKNDSVLLYSLKQNYVYFPKNNIKKEPANELSYFIYNNLVPKNQYIGTRGGHSQRRYLVQHENRLINPKTVRLKPLNNYPNSYYVLDIRNVKDSLITKINLTEAKSKIIFDDALLQSIGDKTKLEDIIISINYYDNETDTIKKVLGSNTYSIKQMDSIVKEVEVLKQILPENKDLSITDEINDYILDYYDYDVLELIMK